MADVPHRAPFPHAPPSPRPDGPSPAADGGVDGAETTGDAMRAGSSADGDGDGGLGLPGALGAGAAGLGGALPTGGAEPGSSPGEEAGGRTGARDHGAPAAGEPGSGRLEVTGSQVAVSALASVSGAFVASMFGVAGTVVGAGVMSVVATVGSAVYRVGIHRTTDRLQRSPVTQLVRPGAPRSPDGAGAPAIDEDDRERAADGAGASGPGAPGWRRRLAERRWGIVAGVALVFAVSLVALTLIELAGQSPLSGQGGDGFAGKTSVGSLIGGGSDTGADDAPGDPTTTAPDGEAPAPDTGSTDPDATTPPDGGVDATTPSSPSTTVPDGGPSDTSDTATVG